MIYSCSNTCVPIKPINGVIRWCVEEEGLLDELEKFKILFGLQAAFSLVQQHLPTVKFQNTKLKYEALLIFRFRYNDDKGFNYKFKPGEVMLNIPSESELIGTHCNIYLNKSLRWDELTTDNCKNLLKVFTHGLVCHVMGIGHVPDSRDVCNENYQPDSKIVFTTNSIERLHSLYVESTLPPYNDKNVTFEYEKFIKELASHRGARFFKSLIQKELAIIANRLGISNDNNKISLLANIYKKLNN